jgi:C-terminal processing protease CtpA/Prc
MIYFKTTRRSFKSAPTMVQAWGIGGNMLKIIGLLLVTLSLAAQARTLTKEQKLEDFRTMVSIINAGYGPLEYKMANKIVDITLLNAQMEQEITKTTTDRDFYYSMVKYIAAYRDGHFGMQVPSTATATIPVSTDLVNGQVLITKIDRTKLPEAKFPFLIGDEIVSVDGELTKDYLDRVSLYIVDGNPLSQRRKTSWTIFFRRAARMPLPTAKSVTVEIRHAASGTVEKTELTWTKAGATLDEAAPLPSPLFRPLGISSLGREGQSFDQLRNFANMDYVHPLADREFSCSGETRVEIPADATMITKEPFVSYYHKTDKGNIGYLRIPHYYPQPKAGENAVTVTLAWLDQYEFAVRELEKNTVGLIIDQDHNCGGSVWVMHKMVALFMDKPFKSMQFELLANKESVIEIGKWMESSTKNSIEMENLTTVLNLVKGTWQNGTSRLTPKTAIDGQDMFPPNAIHYTKPIVMLIDEMSGSGGDGFPALMQGHGRAKLFGQTTSGLGGHVDEYPVGLPNSRLTFRITKSLFYRPDGVAIENNGAVPDVKYVITRDDVMNGFKGYQKAYLEYLTQQLP